MKDNKVKLRHYSGFTIVELLVTIVIIAVLAAIVTVSYRGVTSKANEAALVSDLTNASKKLAMYHAEYGAYPSTDGLNASTNWCPTLPKPDNNYCIKINSGISAVYTSDILTYTLSYTKGTIGYEVANNKSPYNTTPPTTTPITAIGAITGTAQTGQTLTAGAVTPGGATVSYQWQSATTAGGTYSNITGATDSTLVLNPSNINKYIKVVVTGVGVYGGTQTSVASAQIATDANWLTVGTQTWAKVNLNVGTMITSTVEQANNAILEKYCYDNIESNCTANGGLYKWDEAMQYATTEGAKGICPNGSHIPSDNDWKILEVALGMTQAEADTVGSRGANQGTQLKPGGSSGLNLVLAGHRGPNGLFYDPTWAYLWSSTESSENAWYRNLGASSVMVNRVANDKDLGVSVRCLAN